MELKIFKDGELQVNMGVNNPGEMQNAKEIIEDLYFKEQAEKSMQDRIDKAVEEAKQSWEESLLSHIKGFYSVDELYDWLEEVEDRDNVADKAISEALEHTNYDSIDELIDRVEELEGIIYDISSMADSANV